MNVFDLYARLGLDSSEYDKGIDNSKAKAGGIGSALATAAKVGTAALSAAAAGVAAFTKSAISSYADFEQLSGGIETLFGESASKVMAFADEAFKTAGLSANEYMESTISSAAAMINSLGGDQAAAAELMNMSITDMADNVNKMGTTMEAVQNAYRGFSRGNFTMLDNLALGYAGSREGMEALLKKAEELEAQQGRTTKFSIDSYADIVNAIHIVQDEMGITGTTALEAEKTISGSIASMKSAWQNLMTGLGDGNADLGKLIDDVVSRAETVLQNILPVATKALGGIATAIGKLAPVISKKLPEMAKEILPPLLEAAASLVDGLVKALPTILDAISTVIPTLITNLATTLISLAPNLVMAGMDLVMALSQGLIDNIDLIINAGVDMVTQLAVALVDNLPKLIPAAIQAILTLQEKLTDPDMITELVNAAITIMMAIADGIVDALPILIEKAPVIIENLVSALVYNIPRLIQTAFDMVGALAMGIVENLPKIGEAAGEIIGSLLLGLEQLWEKMLEVGGNVVGGIWEGIKNAKDWIIGQLKGFVDGLVGGVKNLLGIQSPSKVFAGIGEMMAAGLGVGFEDEFDKTSRAINNEVSGLTDDISSVGFGTMDFGASSLGRTSAAMINSMVGTELPAGNVTVQVMLPDGVELARAMLPDMFKVASANGTPITARG